MDALCRCGAGNSFDVQIVKIGRYIYFGHIRWVGSKMVHVGQTESSSCGTVTFWKNIS